MIVSFWFFAGLMIFIALGFVVYPLRRSKIAAFLVILLVSIIALLVYSRAGDYKGLKQYWQLKEESFQVKSALSHIKSPQQLIDQLKDHLQKNPTSAQGWFLLGKLYLDTSQFIQAKEALNRARQLSPNNESYVLSYVQADFFVNNKRLSPEDAALLAPILKHDPTNVNAINLLAIDAYLQHHYRVAITYWERLLLIFPSDSDDSKAVLQMIAKAQKNI